jgi:FKBP-type peptidyl-prolyl cis-trans isomerase
MSKKSALARKREAQEAKQRRKSRLIAIGIGTAVVVIVAAIATIVFFAVRNEGHARVAEAGDKLSVYYTLWLEDGSQVESNVGGDPFKFTLGAGDVIKGWDQGLVGMKVGETRTLTIPPDLAYGEEGVYDKEGNETIPPNATLKFKVKLLAVE